ncbi:CpsD/CapB family tyrosine-protein kinase [Planococcus lenghuensis]|uniref:non-specific protein-tyrosine kinase n=1 Tax=Planococcus lenghuensis TaxID=2213202 RepID=A0A1Q2L2D7_9BACL|nr:CpsD/CapB family tyrosine-protein kinase [Planococcus lenghuensis]AQQ54217.1 capsular biosynthesis protein [Planococcus lenghuensis]
MAKTTKKGLQQVARKLIANSNPKSYVSEQYRTVRTNISFSSADKEVSTLLVTSAVPGEGKSTTSANLAVVFAQSGKRVLLVDGDMRKPTSHYTFHVNNAIGLSNLLTRQANMEDAIRRTNIENLDLITSGPIPPNPAELLASRTMDAVLQELLSGYDLVIFDAPPVLSVTDAQILANKCEGTILVVNSGATEKENALKAKEAIQKTNGRILGTVLNNFKFEKENGYYQYYGTAE